MARFCGIWKRVKAFALKTHKILRSRHDNSSWTWGTHLIVCHWHVFNWKRWLCVTLLRDGHNVNQFKCSGRVSDIWDCYELCSRGPLHVATASVLSSKHPPLTALSHYSLHAFKLFTHSYSISLQRIDVSDITTTCEILKKLKSLDLSKDHIILWLNTVTWSILPKPISKWLLWIITKNSAYLNHWTSRTSF